MASFSVLARARAAFFVLALAAFFVPALATFSVLIPALLFSNAGCAASLHASVVKPLPIGRQVTWFESAGRRIRVDEYRPEGMGPRPAVIVIHGSSGVHRHIRNTATEYAKALAEQGINAFVVHYFDSTGTIIGTLASENRNYFTWMQTLTDAVTWVQGLPEVKAGRVGLLGHSLGAFLAVGVAAFDPQVSRVVLFGGALEPFLTEKVKRMPPTLVCHGDSDGTVPLDDARSLVEFLKARGCDAELVTYHGERHIFSESVANDALTRAARFFVSELRD